MLEKARQRARMRELAGDWKGKVEWGCACGAYRGYLLRSEANKDRFGIWVKNDGGRFTGVLSLGEQARRCSGFEIEVWVVVPWSQIRGDEGAAAWLEDVKMGNREAMDWDNVQMYRPTHGVERYSCKKCGASILWVERKRPGVVKVSAGLLKSAEGVRAEDWITWELSEDQEGADPGVVEELRNALQSWNETMKTALHTQDTK
ncbi:hypothetical protein KVT40_000570 [Elsinoe batatas]|uniref:CENP-V/GFA domain-containing protein n=1 Tax=Elsinoe batatas TaxID=2601811 RepID=A0A8K0L9V0_9PEZI|nr:hypothetical protein KVT40_000570 [Elsinoe batatas]